MILRRYKSRGEDRRREEKRNKRREEKRREEKRKEGRVVNRNSEEGNVHK